MSPKDEPPRKACPKCNGQAELVPWESRHDRENTYETYRCPKCGYTWETATPIPKRR